MKNEKEIKYIIHPEFIISKNDGDRHYISGEKLINLYGLDPRECIIIDSKKIYTFKPNKKHFHLHPRYEGDYTEYLKRYRDIKSDCKKLIK